MVGARIERACIALQAIANPSQLSDPEGPKSHPRQWVDISGPAYNALERALRFCSLSSRREEKNDNNVIRPALSGRLDLNEPPTAVVVLSHSLILVESMGLEPIHRVCRTRMPPTTSTPHF